MADEARCLSNKRQSISEGKKEGERERERRETEKVEKAHKRGGPPTVVPPPPEAYNAATTYRRGCRYTNVPLSMYRCIDACIEPSNPYAISLLTYHSSSFKAINVQCRMVSRSIELNLVRHGQTTANRDGILVREICPISFLINFLLTSFSFIWSTITYK